MDYLHGTEYPEPFFSIEKIKWNASNKRSYTSSICRLFVIYHPITKKSNLDIGGKIFFFFYFFKFYNV